MSLILEDPVAFRAALAKGLGRTLLTLEQRHAEPYRAAILDACLTCEPHRFWFEPNPAPYVVEHVRAAGIEDSALDTILQAYTPELPEHIRWHIASILGEYARAGKQRALEKLFEHAFQGDQGAWSALEIYPIGIAWLVEHILPTLPMGERYHLKDWLAEVPEDDAEKTSQILRAAESEYRAFLDRSLADQPAKLALDPSTFLNTPPSERNTSEGWTFAFKASEAQLAIAAKEFAEASSEEAIKALYRIFTKFPFPLNPALLVARADEDELGWAFRAAMSQVDSPLVRDYALRLLNERPLPFHAIWSLESSFKPGDEPTLLHALRSIEHETDERLHHYVKCLRNLLERQSTIDLEPFDHWIYEKSPCASCRAIQVRWMIEDNALPEAMAEELRYDIDLELRDEVRAYVLRTKQANQAES